MLLSFFYPGWLAGWLAGWLQCGWNQIKRSFENNNRRQEKKQQENIDTLQGGSHDEYNPRLDYACRRSIRHEEI